MTLNTGDSELLKEADWQGRVGITTKKEKMN